MTEDAQPTLSHDDQQLVRELAWKMLDGCLEEEEAEQLDLLLLHSEAARRRYVEVVQMHVDLLDKFGGIPRSDELLRKLLDAKLTPSSPAVQPPSGEIPTTEPSGA